jgi:hypothetical protein
MHQLPPAASPERHSLERRFWAKVRKGTTSVCWEWQASFTRHGYGRFNLSGYDNERAHRVALALSLDRSLASAEWALHTCDNRACCNPSHLYVGDRSANMKDAVARGRWASPAIGNSWTRGSRNGQARLTEESARQVRAGIQAGETNRSLARQFGVSATTISLIRSGKRWAHAQPA